MGFFDDAIPLATGIALGAVGARAWAETTAVSPGIKQWLNEEPPRHACCGFCETHHCDHDRHPQKLTAVEREQREAPCGDTEYVDGEWVPCQRVPGHREEHVGVVRGKPVEWYRHYLDYEDDEDDEDDED